MPWPSDDYHRGYAHGCKAALAVYEAMLDDLTRKVAQHTAAAEQRVAEADRAAAELEAKIKTYVAETERRIAEAAAEYGVDFETSSSARKH
jgi:uncharacterized protein (DUF2164 family)